MHLLTAKQVRSVSVDAATEQKLLRQRITFGQIKDALKASSAFHDSQLESDVELFVSQRNHVASGGGNRAVRLERVLRSWGIYCSEALGSHS